MLIEDYLPRSAQELARRIGLPALQALVEWRPGVPLSVPSQRVKDDHELVRRLGRQAADELVHWCGGTEIEIPKCHASIVAARQAEAVAMRKTTSESQTALATGYSARHVRRLWAGECGDDGQQDLFEEKP